MTTAIRVLHLEDDPADAQRIRGTLEDEGLVCDIVWVQTREHFVRALERQAFDLVLSDYEAGGLEMLHAVHQQQPQALLIVLSTRLISEEEAVECMKAGATDYVFKERVRRLWRARVHGAGAAARHRTRARHRLRHRRRQAGCRPRAWSASSPGAGDSETR